MNQQHHLVETHSTASLTCRYRTATRWHPSIVRAASLLLLAALSGGAVWLSAEGATPAPAGAAQEVQLYTCGMHPQVIQDHPGNCPICGMKLTPVRKQAGATPAGTDASASAATAITIDPATVQNMNLRTAPVTSGPLRRTVRTVGVVDFDETALTDVSTKFKGWIEKLYVDSTGQQVHRGDPLFEIYSPDLYSAQVEYLLTLNQPTNLALTGAQALQASALLKLKFLDVPEEEIAQLKRDGQARKTLRINAPRDGIVVDKQVVEGQMVEAGMKLYRLADLGTVWVQAQVYEQDLPFVRLGQEATVSLSYLSDRKFRGRVTYIYPTVDEKTRTAKVRMEFHNPGYFLKPGMFATVELTAELSPAVVLVPSSAVLRSGESNTVFVALEGGKFDPRAVTLGLQTEADQYQVLSGLSEGERVVTSGQFLLDSESQLREAIDKMRGPSAVGRASVPANPNPSEQRLPSGLAGTLALPTPVIYICPMPEHVSLEYDHPGKCPLCGMTLVPVTRETLSKIQPGGQVEYYTCPMPEHSDVHSDKPGKCPKCGMTLIPVMVQPKPAQGTNAAAGAAQPLPAKLYTCPMASDAEVVSDKPGECPKCGMKLVETSTVAHGKVAEANWRKQHPTGTQEP
jgi:RND family efflux transporter MFP subunit